MLYILIVISEVIALRVVRIHIEKNMQLDDSKEIMNGKVTLKKQYNRGMFLNLLEDKVDTVKKISVVLLGVLLLTFAILLPKKNNRLFKLAISLCLGGAISNVYERLRRGYVTDYFSFNCKPLKSIVFNLADMCIILGSFLLLLISLFSPKCKCSTDKASK
ncbi:MAG TPA: signal peptidase II [Mobilitalea sp.]|nr:signal peptidase II [Mobilitalea sp.]